MNEPTYLTPNRGFDMTGCEHRWVIPVESGHLGPPDERYTLREALMRWCTKCGSVAWGQRYPVLLVPEGWQSPVETDDLA